MDYFIQFIDDSRIECDALIQTAISLKTTAETTLAWRSLQMGKAWLGKVKAAFGETNPYSPVSEEKDISATNAIYIGESHLTNDKLANINSIRERIESLIAKFATYTKNMSADDLGKKEIDYSLQHLAEAKMWYGFELSNMRDFANQEKQ